jgi:hypothetical protein
VEKLEALRTTVSDSLKAKDTNKADDAVHEVGHVLEDIPELAKEAVDEAQHADLKKDVEELFDHFEKLDDEIHSGKEVSYDAVGEKIDAAIERLHARIKK